MMSSSGPVFHHLKTNSEDDLVSELSSEQDHNYMVDVPPTPDNQTGAIGLVTLQQSSSRVVEDQYASSSLFTGGFNCATRAHLKEKVIDSETSHPQMTGVKGSSCSMPGCDARVLTDERGVDVHPCECGLKFCRDCYRSATKSGDGVCPGCKESYKGLGEDYERPSMAGIKMEREASLSLKNMALVKSYSNVLEESKWMYETKGSYGYGNATWSKEEDGFGGDPPAFRDKPWRPLTRKLNISAAILSPYRILILVRMVALGLFLFWRIRNPNNDAVWLWFMSVICEIWFAFSWLLDQLPKLCPVNRVTDLDVLREKFEAPNPRNPTGISDLPGVDIFVSTADPEKEVPLVTANTILSILAADYPVEKLSCYVSDDGGSLLTFEAIAEAASFADLWVPFCRKHDIEPRNPESYFNMKIDPYKNKVLPDFVRDRRRVKREYDEFKVRVNALSDSIRRRGDAFNAREEMKAMKILREKGIDEAFQTLKIPKATWMADQTHWPGTWEVPAHEHTRANHSSIIQVMLEPPSNEPLKGDGNVMDLSEVDIRLPMLVYVSREKRHGYDHSNKAGSMNALLRASAIMSNGSCILDIDCDHYIHNSKAIREGMCFMMDRSGDSVAYVQFPQRFEGIDPSDRYANKNTVFFDVNMRALDGIQGPIYAGTGCLFRRIALYGFDPPELQEHPSCYSKFFLRRKKAVIFASDPEEGEEMDISIISNGLVKTFGNSSLMIDSIPKAVEQGKPLADHPSVKHGRPPGALTAPRDPLDASIVAEAVDVVSCWYEDKTEWGGQVGWVYGSVTEEVVTGYRMHNHGWRSVYCATNRDAFRGTAPINLTDRLHQVLRWATGSVEMFFSRNNALLASSRLKLLQRIAYLNLTIHPFTSPFLVVYCFLPAMSLFTGQFVVRALDVTFLTYLLAITLTFCFLAVLEIKWSGILLEEWWRNEQFWVIGGTSAHIAAVFQGMLKAVAGIEISFTLKLKSVVDGDNDDEFADMYVFKWTAMMVLPITIMMVNLVGLAVAVSRTIHGTVTNRGELIGGVFLSAWVLVHLYPFAKGLMGKRGKAPTIVFVWSGLLAITISLLWVAIDHPASNGQTGWSFGLP